jgi:metal-dependent hydrolase (beta-lactamase superfamily II)
MKISFHGAARSVTGSRHLVQAGSSRLLLDCGMFQGGRDQAAKLNCHLGFDPPSLTEVCLSHAHIDHSGILPVLAREGYSDSVYMTDTTADLSTTHPSTSQGGSGSMDFLLTRTGMTCWLMFVPFSPHLKKFWSSMGKNDSPWPLS